MAVGPAGGAAYHTNRTWQVHAVHWGCGGGIPMPTGDHHNPDCSGVSQRHTSTWTSSLCRCSQYAWYEALTSPGNWLSAGGVILAMISLLLHAIQRFRSTSQQGAADTRTAVGVTITNTQEPAPQCKYVREAWPTTAKTRYGIAEVTEATMAAVRAAEQVSLTEL